MTRRFVKNSRNDSAMGIFIKAGKDAWAAGLSAEMDIAQKYVSDVLAIFADISGSEFSILDAPDSLNAILNWLRLILGRNIECDRKFVADRLSIVNRKIDAELRAVGISDLQRTRVLLLGDLSKCVSELLDRRLSCPSPCSL